MCVVIVVVPLFRSSSGISSSSTAAMLRACLALPLLVAAVTSSAITQYVKVSRTALAWRCLPQVLP